MIRIVALGLIYMGLLFAFAAGIEALAGEECSDWLTSCNGEQLAGPQASDPDEGIQPQPPELH